MTTTPHLALPLLAASQAQKHVTHNESLAALDALVHLSVKECGRVAEPGAPQEGDRYLVGSGATGRFAGHDGEVALFDLGIWRFFTPRPGWRAYVEGEDRVIVFDGSAWHDISRSIRELGNLDLLGIGTTADSLNRLSVKLNAALFAALVPSEGGTGDLRFVLNKDGVGNVLSQLYQRNFSGRAETGLIGSDDFSIRTSLDGSQWRDALVADSETGLVSFPNGISNVPRPNLLFNSAFLVNQRGFPGGSLGGGVYGFDRWKGGAGGCSLNLTPDGTVTLSGTLEQVIDVGHAAALTGHANLAGVTLILSVEELSGSLPVMIGTRSAVIPAGPGRCSVTVTLDGSDTGNITVRLQPSGVCSFKRIKLGLGSYATPWIGEPREIEELRCRRYYQRLAVGGGAPAMLCVPGQRVAGNIIDIPYLLPVPMRASPAFVTSAPAWVNGAPAGNQIGFFNNRAGVWGTASGAVAELSAVPSSQSFAVLRLQAATSLSGAAGDMGSVYLGSSAYIALQAEL